MDFIYDIKDLLNCNLKICLVISYYNYVILVFLILYSLDH